MSAIEIGPPIDGSSILKFVVPGEPRGKGRPRAVAFRPKGRPYLRARMYPDEKTVNFEALVAGAFASAYPYQVPIDGPVQILVDAFFAIPASASKTKRAAMIAEKIRPTKKPDAVNILAAVSDALKGLAYRDDAQHTDAFCRRYFAERPRTEVTILAGSPAEKS